MERTPTIGNISQTEGQEKRASLQWSIMGQALIPEPQLQLRKIGDPAANATAALG
jgi:hypothetical protein